MIIRKLTEKDREFYKKLNRYCEEASENTYEEMKWPPDNRPMDTFYGAFEKDELLAGVGVIPFEIKFRGKVFSMGGVDGVGTKPEYRNQGLIRAILTKIFEELYNNIPEIIGKREILHLQNKIYNLKEKWKIEG